MKKKKSVDESFQFGAMEVSRIGNLISMKNIGNEDEKDELIKGFANQYKSISLQINNLISEIKDLVSSCNPLELLKYGYNNFINFVGGSSF